jgi:hypothetical protein
VQLNSPLRTGFNLNYTEWFIKYGHECWRWLFTSCGQNVHMSGFECLRRYGRLNLRIQVKHYWKIIVSFPSPSLFYLLVHSGCRRGYFHLITLRHTPQSVGLLWTRDRPVAETSDWQHTHKRQTLMPPVGFEPTIPASARPQTYVLDRAATGIGLKNYDTR